MSDCWTKIQVAFLKVYAENKANGVEGASAREVTEELVRAGSIHSMDAVGDVAKHIEEMASLGYFVRSRE